MTSEANVQARKEITLYYATAEDNFNTDNYTKIPIFLKPNESMDYY